jgi:nucleotide-binding universal stress UspA family protein
MNEIAATTTPDRSTLCTVVGFAFTDADGPAFDQAARIASRVPRSELHVVHVFPTELSAEKSHDLVGHLRLYVDEKAAIGNALQGITVGIHLRTGNPVREIAQLATEVRADLIVLGSQKGPHLKHWIVGSTAEKLIASASCPVLVASPKPTAVQKYEPTIEPACPECVQTRVASLGATWWCGRHSNVATGAHTYSYQREMPFASHDSAVSPTGVDF